MPGSRIGCSIAAAAVLIAARASAREVPLHVEPPQPVQAISIEAGGAVLPVAVKGGNAIVPDGAPLPWRVNLARFEPAVYTLSDLDAHRPLVLRELGRVSGTLLEARRPIDHPFAVYLQRDQSAAAEEYPFVGGNGGAGSFELRLPAGLYRIAAGSESCGTRIRSGIVVRAGQTTDAGALLCEATTPVAIRVVDAKNGQPVAGAKVVWDPPEALNAREAKVMFARRWSAVTDRRGMTAFRVGPLPIAVRWHVENSGYGTESTARTELHAGTTAVTAIPDVRLRRSPTLRVHTTVPDGEADFRGASLVVGDAAGDHTRRFVERLRAKLATDVSFALDSYGEKRVWIVSAAGRKLLYRDFRLESVASTLEIVPQRIEIAGRVTDHAGDAVEHASVVLSDPSDTRVPLANVATNDHGDYSMTTWASGELHLHVTRPSRAGILANSSVRTIHTTGGRSYRADIQFDGGGASLAVVDAQTDAPVRARVRAQIVLANGETHVAAEVPTDERGRFSLDGFSEGEATADVSASGYRVQQVDLHIRRDGDAVKTVRLERARALKGRIVDERGLPVSRAAISGGYDAMGFLNRYEATTDSAGEFRFDPAPPQGLTFYVVAAGYTLAVTQLLEGRDNLVVLDRPGTAVLYVTENHAPPPRMYRIAVAPRGDELVPYTVLVDLAEANGMTEYQLYACGRDGAVVLPEFLGPGAWDFYVTRRNRGSTSYQQIGTVTLPAARAPVLNVSQ